MGKDIIHKRCLGDNSRYADLLNGLLFAGRQKIHPDDLEEIDSQGESGKQRDMLKKAACGAKFYVFGVENQEKVHYLMPLRSMLYDALEYDRQARVRAKRLRSKQRKRGKEAENGELPMVSDAEYLSGFCKTDKLLPCITLVLYYGDEWDGGRDLTDILELSELPEELRKYVNHYPMHLVEVKKFKDGDTDVFQTDLKQIFNFIRYSKDKKKLLEMVESDPAYRELDEDAYEMMLAYVNDRRLITKKEEYEKGGKVDMCKAIEDLVADKIKEGRELGLEQGRKEGRKEGREIGLNCGIEIFVMDHKEDGTSRERVLDKLINRFGMTREKAEGYLEKCQYTV